MNYFELFLLYFSHHDIMKSHQFVILILQMKKNSLGAASEEERDNIYIEGG